MSDLLISGRNLGPAAPNLAEGAAVKSPTVSAEIETSELKAISKAVEPPITTGNTVSHETMPTSSLPQTSNLAALTAEAGLKVQTALDGIFKDFTAALKTSEAQSELTHSLHHDPAPAQKALASLTTLYQDPALTPEDRALIEVSLTALAACELEACVPGNDVAGLINNDLLSLFNSSSVSEARQLKARLEGNLNSLTAVPIAKTLLNIAETKLEGLSRLQETQSQLEAAMLPGHELKLLNLNFEDLPGPALGTAVIEDHRLKLTDQASEALLNAVGDHHLKLNELLERPNLSFAHEALTAHSHHSLEALNKLTAGEDLKTLENKLPQITEIVSQQLSAADAESFKIQFNDSLKEALRQEPLLTAYAAGPFKEEAMKISAERLKSLEVQLAGKSLEELISFKSGLEAQAPKLGAEDYQKLVKTTDDKLVGKLQEAFKADLPSTLVAPAKVREIAALYSALEGKPTTLAGLKSLYPRAAVEFVQVTTREDARAFATKLFKAAESEPSLGPLCLKLCRALGAGSKEVRSEGELNAGIFESLQTVKPLLTRLGITDPKYTSFEKLEASSLMALTSSLLLGRTVNGRDVSALQSANLALYALSYQSFVKEQGGELRPIASDENFLKELGEAAPQLTALLTDGGLRLSSSTRQQQRLETDLRLFRHNPQLKLLRKTFKQADPNHVQHETTAALKSALCALCGIKHGDFADQAAVGELTALAARRSGRVFQAESRKSLADEAQALAFLDQLDDKPLEGEISPETQQRLEIEQQIAVKTAHDKELYAQVAARAGGIGKAGEMVGASLLLTQELLAQDASDLTAKQLALYNLSPADVRANGGESFAKEAVLLETLTTFKDRISHSHYALIANSYLTLKAQDGVSQREALQELSAAAGLSQADTEQLAKAMDERSSRQYRDIKDALSELKLWKGHGSLKRFTDADSSDSRPQLKAMARNFENAQSLEEARQAFKNWAENFQDLEHGAEHISEPLDLLMLSREALIAKEYKNLSSADNLRDAVHKTGLRAAGLGAQAAQALTADYVNLIDRQGKLASAHEISKTAVSDALEGLAGESRTAARYMRDLEGNLKTAALNLTLLDKDLADGRAFSAALADPDKREEVTTSLQTSFENLGVPPAIARIYTEEITTGSSRALNKLRTSLDREAETMPLSRRQKAIRNAGRLVPQAAGVIAGLAEGQTLMVNSRIGAGVGFNLVPGTVRLNAALANTQSLSVSRGADGVTITLSNALQTSLNAKATAAISRAQVSVEGHASGTAMLKFPSLDDAAVYLAFTLSALEDLKMTEASGAQAAQVSLNLGVSADGSLTVISPREDLNPEARERVLSPTFSAHAGGGINLETTIGFNEEVRTVSSQITLKAGLSMQRQAEEKVKPVAISRIRNRSLKDLAGAGLGLSKELTVERRTAFRSALGGEPVLSADFSYTLTNPDADGIALIGEKCRLSRGQIENLQQSLAQADPKPRSLSLQGTLHFDPQDKLTLKEASELFAQAQDQGQLPAERAYFAGQKTLQNKGFTLNVAGLVSVSHQRGATLSSVTPLDLSERDALRPQPQRP